MKVTPDQLKKWTDKGLKVIGSNQSTTTAPEKKKRKMNRTEAYYALQLEALKQTGQIIHWGFEEITLTLDSPDAKGTKKTKYTPDFFVVSRQVILPMGGVGSQVIEHIEFHETKGAHVWEDAIIKFKWARKQYPWFTFKMMQHKGGTWSEIYPQ